MADQIDEVVERLVREVEQAVHALYRGDTRQATAKARTGHLTRAAAEALRRMGGVPTAAAVGHPVTPTGATPAAWTREDHEAVMKCVTAWLPMGPPASALPDSRCIASGRELVPEWSERERARAALQKVTPV